MSRLYFQDLDFNRFTDRTVILDLDGCLTPDNETTVTGPVLAAVKTLTADNQVFLLSNKKNHQRNQRLADELGIEYLATSLRKPDPRLKRFLAARGATSPFTVIGDKYLTDGLLAKVLGAEFIKVRRLIGSKQTSFGWLADRLDDWAFTWSRGLKLLRPAQWLKNALILAPLVFAHQLANGELLLRAGLGVVIFSLMASAVYLINDLIDREADRRHPQKKFRPLAAGDFSPAAAVILAIALFMLVAALTLIFFPNTAPLLLAYLGLNLIYSWWLKHWPVVDVVTVAGFYLFRIIYGGEVVAVPVSAWLILCTLFLAMLIATSKRLGELARGGARSVLQIYSADFLKQLTLGAGVLALMSYGIYTVASGGSSLLLYSNLPAVVGVFRLIYLAERGSDTETPELLVLRDRGILGSVLIWLGLVVASLYF